MPLLFRYFRERSNRVIKRAPALCTALNGILGFELKAEKAELESATEFLVVATRFGFVDSDCLAHLSLSDLRKKQLVNEIDSILVHEEVCAAQVQKPVGRLNFPPGSRRGQTWASGATAFVRLRNERRGRSG